jgi:hypothetical protein
MNLHRHTFADPYIVAELRRQYEGADTQGRIELLAELYKDGGHLPYEIAALAVVDPNTKVRGWIARHGRGLDYEDKQQPDADRRLDERLKGDADPLVRAQLRENPDILGLLSLGHSKQWFHDSSHLERLALVRNPRIEEVDRFRRGASLRSRSRQQVLKFRVRRSSESGDPASELSAWRSFRTSFCSNRVAWNWPRGPGNWRGASPSRKGCMRAVSIDLLSAPASKLIQGSRTFDA